MQAVARFGLLTFGLQLGRYEHRPVDVRSDDARVYVTFAADSRRIPQLLGRPRDGLDHVVLCLGLRLRWTRTFKGMSRRDRAGPCAEILGREVLSRDLMQVPITSSDSMAWRAPV